MDLSDRAFVDKITKKLSPKLKSISNVKADLKQEIYLAVLLFDSAQKIEEHMLLFVSKTKTKETPSGLLKISHDPFEQSEACYSRERLTFILNLLIDCCPPEQKILLLLKYGLRDGRCRNDKEIAQFFNVSVKRIKELEKKAIQTIRDNKGSEYIKSRFL